MRPQLYDKLLKYSNTKYPYHMPGHKFGRGFDLADLSLLSLDATEVPELDNLYNATGVIKDAMTDMAKFYKSQHCIFLTNGATAGILASILAVCKPKDKFIVAKNSHHSVINALILADAVPVYISPEILSCGIVGSIKAEDIKKILVKHPDIKGAIITSPTYEGVFSDLVNIRAVLKDQIIIVDEAHGAHLNIMSIPSAITAGADLVINSMHKTLPALTQSALLHICTNKIKYADVIESLKMIQTSSPSYLLMGLMDYIRFYIEKNMNAIKQNYVVELLQIRKNLKQLKKLRLLETPNMQDPAKIVILTNNYINGKNLANVLDTKYNIVIEAFFETHVILITSPADTKKEFDALLAALMIIDSELLEPDLTNKCVTNIAIAPSDVAEISLGELRRSAKIEVAIFDATDRIAGLNIILFPPGIPIVCLGEKITDIHINSINQNLDNVIGVSFINAVPHVLVLEKGGAHG
ncbi:aminotransferase class I/II-fold pyridoxal phosphate-dependent enzyme [Candidatus Epulonipiscium viviparus]|uniref:aminotransferase class I/II-fold pyridoxal phosphate-dependent enzyme n=1 Tax=Candidatus Epulonipiscium viviparus TaxID=420336 RepID=UPI0027380B53|nr:aminotransferase class I/II-fold pyridoxal phosphate-dependent enzyme [Candidatus Epulopiscium viviparus]